MSLHAASALQVIWHCDPDAHVMSLHAPAAEQSATHLTPDGHVNGPDPVVDSVHTCGVTLVSQLSHCDGHAPTAPITQKPSTHVRGAVQSDGTLHASVSDLRSTKHADPNHAATATVAIASRK